MPKIFIIYNFRNNNFYTLKIQYKFVLYFLYVIKNNRNYSEKFCERRR